MSKKQIFINVIGSRDVKPKVITVISAIPQRDLDPAFEYMDELRTMTEMQEVIADRHRVKMNSLMGM